MGRALIVSNRLPVTVKRGETGLTLERSSGGLATGLRSVHEQADGLGFGWTGLSDTLSDAEREQLEGHCRKLRLCPVALSTDELAAYYEGYCNGMVWPLFHSFPSTLPLEPTDFEMYRKVNARFADAVAAHWREGDLV